MSPGKVEKCTSQDGSTHLSALFAFGSEFTKAVEMGRRMRANAVKVIGHAGGGFFPPISFLGTYFRMLVHNSPSEQRVEPDSIKTPVWLHSPSDWYDN